jgi:1A family penicillin-binding protein
MGTVGMVAVFGWYSRDLPDPDKILDRSVAQSTKIYDRTGEHLLYEIHGDENRTLIELEDIPDSARWATILMEDRSFYEHQGFDLIGIIRAILANILRGGKAQGGSTITQQFVKNAILTTEKSYERKIKELILSYQIERKFSKDEILKLYFNEIPYGSTAYGIESAAQMYFGKQAKNLTTAESALLAALPQAPTYYSPYGNHTDALLARQQHVIDLMVKHGKLSKEEGERAKAVEILHAIQPRRESIRAPHFVFFVREYLTKKYLENTVEQGGLKVITTLDWRLQEIAEDVIKNGVPKYVDSKGGDNSALVAEDPHTGQILAMVGSRDYFDTEHAGNLNHAIRPRQPGSSFKPIVYATAFKIGYTPDTILFDLETDFPTDNGNYHPRNYNGKENGPLPMKKALAGSLNIPAVKTLYLVGINNALDTAEKLGYTTFKDRSRFGLALVLGGGEVTLLDHVSAYATFAREGIRHPPTGILRVEDHNGALLEEYHETQERVFDAIPIRQLNHVLSTDSYRSFIFGSGSRLTLPGRPVAAKTGTTNDNKDVWIIGYTPSLVTGIWSGNSDGRKMHSNADGSNVSAPMWNEFMRRALQGSPVEAFREPPAIEADKDVLNGKIGTPKSISVDRVTKKRIPEACLATYPPDFIEVNEVREVHDILHYVNKRDPRGPAPSDPKSDPHYDAWEKKVQQWAKDKKEYQTTIEEGSCDIRDPENLPTMTLIAPDDGAILTPATFTISATPTAPQGVTQVRYYIDTTLIDTKSEEPYQTTYTPSDLTPGAHTLRVIVEDVSGNLAEDRASFTYQTSDAVTTLFFVHPTTGETLQPINFPYTVTVFASNPEGILQVDVFVYETEKGAESATKLLPIGAREDNHATFQWDQPLVAGAYRLYAVATDARGGVTTTDHIPVTYVIPSSLP